jgi:hypothetical protein
MAEAIELGMGDRDGHATLGELRAFLGWAQRNAHRMSAPAREVFAVYERYGREAQARGEGIIPPTQLRQMVGEMRRVAGPRTDEVLARLEQVQGFIRGLHIAAGIEQAVGACEGRVALEGVEQVAAWARGRSYRLSPEAGQVLSIAERHVQQARARGGEERFGAAQLQGMLREMEAVQDVSPSRMVRALACLSGTLTGEHLLEAFRLGAEDFEGPAAAGRVEQFEQWVQWNTRRLSLEARQAVSIFGRSLCEARARGEAGLGEAPLRRMLREISAVVWPSQNALVFPLHRIRC